MRAQVPNLGAIAKGISYAESEPGDSLVRIPPLLMPTAEVTFPVRRLFSAPTTGIFTDSLFLSDSQLMSVSTNITLITLGEGLWRCWWQHYLDQTGAVNDGSSLCDIKLNLNTIFGSPITLSRIRNTLIQQRNEGEFSIVVEKGNELSFSRISVAGLGTGTANSLFHIAAHKIL